METQFEDVGSVRAVHVMPSSDVAAIVDEAATAKNALLPYVTDRQTAVVGKVRAVQFMPSGEDAAIVPEVSDTATKRPLP